MDLTISYGTKAEECEVAVIEQCVAPHLVLAEETLAEDKVSVWEVGECLDEDLACH